MSYQWGKRSLSKLHTCHPDIQRLCHRIIQHTPTDITVVWGFRNQKQQDEAFLAGASKKRWPESMHNFTLRGRPCSLAVDLAPWINGTIPWDSPSQFYFMSGFIIRCAQELSIKVRWGGDWDSDGNVMNQTFNDLGHFELVPKRGQ
jgi:peptidoglycan L-alanyl-D-glutamate endopeptidase CwlK